MPNDNYINQVIKSENKCTAEMIYHCGVSQVLPSHRRYEAYFTIITNKLKEIK